MMHPLSRTSKTIPFEMVGSTKFGRYPKISTEQTFNMIMSDGWLVPHAGYRIASMISPGGQGRGLYASSKYQHLIAVINNSLYTIDASLSVSKIASLKTSKGDVTIAENNAGQFAICDKKHIYIFDYLTGKFTIPKLDFLPGYVDFQNTYFISVDQNTAQWRLSLPNNGNQWPDLAAGATYVGEFQTKADIPVAAVRVPGRGNLLFVMGSNVTELWFNTGQQLFPYSKNEYLNIDYGCINAATIARNDQMLVWLARNEQSGPAIMVSMGDEPQQISNDGINFKLAQLQFPEESYGFLFKQDGHLLYQITFTRDNLTYTYDFNTQAFFSLSDENMNCHIAKKVVYFNNTHYFISIRDGNLYQMDSSITTYVANEIPRVRICKNIRLPDSSLFIIPNLTFTMEQGESAAISRVDMSISRDGGQQFSNYEQYELNPLAHRPNNVQFWQLGMANDFVPQFRFWGHGRFVVNNGTVSYYQ